MKDPNEAQARPDSATLLDRLIEETRLAIADYRLYGMWPSSPEAWLKHQESLIRDLRDIWNTMEDEILSVGRSEHDLHAELLALERTLAKLRPHLPVWVLRDLDEKNPLGPSQEETRLTFLLERARSLLTPEKRALFDSLRETEEAFGIRPDESTL